ncbi:MAG: hypothetical protein QM535_11440 [Limnohabitans sp.]|nr:hypothetical protein [Limnohabitans sp.]
MIKKSISILILGSAIYACGPKATQSTPEIPSTPEVKVSEATLAEGKTLYENNCGKCHKLYEPSAYGKDRWVKILNWMAPKAKITDEQKAKVFAYVSYGK